MTAAVTDERDQALATELMRGFAERTGLSSARAPRRYLWTDAFAVCNFLALARAGEPDCAALAARLVEQVHQVLGRHRPDDSRHGWISGLPEAAGAAQPTVGGLRIGKPLPERGARDPFDTELEWERDGQYFHYLTRWMHALDQYAHADGPAEAGRWACELAQSAVTAFGRPARGARLAWKMSIDLQRAQVPSSGQHDALDGLVTCLQLQARRTRDVDAPDLSGVIVQLEAMAAAGDWRTDDPLGLGGLLADAWRLMQLPREQWRREQWSGEGAPRIPMIQRLLDDASIGLAAYAQRQPLQHPVSQRLAFRELGLAIGLHAVAHMQAAAAPFASPDLATRLQSLSRYLPLARAIDTFWRDPAMRQSPSWQAHEDINAVMLATSLVPSGYLDLR